MPQPDAIAMTLRAFLRDHPEGVRERVLIRGFVEMAGQPREHYDSVVRSFLIAGWIERDGDRIVPAECIL